MQKLYGCLKRRNMKKLDRIHRIATKMVELEDLTYEESLKVIQLIKLEEESGDQITIYKLMNDLEESDNKDQLSKRECDIMNLKRRLEKMRKGTWQ